MAFLSKSASAIVRVLTLLTTFHKRLEDLPLIERHTSICHIYKRISGKGPKLIFSPQYDDIIGKRVLLLVHHFFFWTCMIKKNHLLIIRDFYLAWESSKRISYPLLVILSHPPYSFLKWNWNSQLYVHLSLDIQIMSKMIVTKIISDQNNHYG